MQAEQLLPSKNITSNMLKALHALNPPKPSKKTR